MQESLSRLQSKEFQAYRLKKDSFQAGIFLCVLPNISERFFFFLQSTSVWLYLLNTPFLFVTATSTGKNAPFNLGYFKYVREKHC